jgi:hypothetical protein
MNWLNTNKVSEPAMTTACTVIIDGDDDNFMMMPHHHGVFFVPRVKKTDFFCKIFHQPLHF